MLFSAPIVAITGLLAAAPSVLAAITITGPSSSAFWVQNRSNTITWEFAPGDPNPVTITVTNPNNTFLNGPFSIAENVDLSNKTFTVTNVTLNVHDGYVVNFVNQSNITQVFASSQTFQLKPPGTPPAAQATATGSSPTASGTSPAGSGNGTAGNGTTTASNSSSTAKTAPSGSLRSFEGTFASLAPMLGMSVVIAMVGAATTF